MKMFIKGNYVDLEKFHHFYYNETSGEMIFMTQDHAGDDNGVRRPSWAKIPIKMTKEEYTALCNDISNIFKIPHFLKKG